MKILWVEDSPDDKEAVKAILEKYDPKLDKALSYQDAISKVKNAIESYDVIFLDINLTGKIGEEQEEDARYLAGVEDDEGHLTGRAKIFKLGSAKSFLKEAGFHVYIELIDIGYPKDRIAFISANSETSEEFFAKFHAARMEPPKSFDSSKEGIDSPNKDPLTSCPQGIDELTKWLQDRNTDYIKLRRGIIDACDELKADENIQKLNKDLGLSETNIKDKLDELSQILPIRKPDEIAKERLLKRIARAIVHDWESYDPSKSTKYNNQNGYGYILKTGRNWLTHDTAHNIKVDERTIAFLFILHIRSVFKLNSEGLEGFESKLLQLFTAIELEEEMLKKDIKSSYRKIWSGDHYSNLYFLNLCDAQHKLDEKRDRNIENHNYRSLLFQSFFHLRFPVKCKLIAPNEFESKRSGKAPSALKAFFSFGYDRDGFISRINKSPFEVLLLKEFYSAAFSES